MAWEAIVPGWGDLTTVVLLYGNDAIQLSKYLRLYIYISAVLTLGQISFCFQWAVIDTETHNWVSG